MQYWSDSVGFHQNDNLPRFDLQPVTETPEVRQAREEHERLWNEAARLNGVDPDSSYSPSAEKLDNESYDDADLDGQVSNQHQSLLRYPVLPYSQHIEPDNAKVFGKVVDDAVVVESRVNEARARFARQQTSDIEEVTSEPRGFFYSFDYQVPFIVDRNARAKQGLETQASEQIEVRSNSEDAQAQTDRSEVATQSPRVSEDILGKVIANDELHDAQTSPLQRPSARQSDAPVRLPSVKADARPRPTMSGGRGSVKFTTRAT